MMSDPGDQLALVVRAADFAARKHSGQRRKGPNREPYIEHPLAVCHALAQAGVRDAEVLAAALLHDTVEDTQTTPEELQREFGARVAGIVGEVSDDKRLPKAARKRLQIAHARGASDGAKLVKMGDKIANVRDLLRPFASPWDVARTQGYVVWARAVCEQLRGTNAALDAQADALWAASFVAGRRDNATTHPAIPEGDPAQILEAYYASL